MKFGISTIFFKSMTVEEALRQIAHIGYQSAEIWKEHLDRTGESPELLLNIAAELHLDLSLHAASYDLNLTSSNRGIRLESMRQVLESIDVARRLDAKVVVVHPGKLSSSKDQAEDFWPILIDVVNQIDRFAAACEVRVGMELMEQRPREFFITPEDGTRLMAVNLSNTGLTVDIAHLNTFTDPLDAVRRLDSASIFHFHLSDNNPTRTHLPLGQGNVNIQSVLKEISPWFSGIVSIEGAGLVSPPVAAKDNYLYLKNQGYL